MVYRGRADRGRRRSWDPVRRQPGKPFARDNVVALSRIGMSSKPPGEAIGNKGLGFRSVSHVCEAPEIYSQLRLTQATDIRRFLLHLRADGDLSSRIDNPTVLKLALSDLPMFFLPIALGEQPSIARQYAERGFSSVIRLPLRDNEFSGRQKKRSTRSRTARLLYFYSLSGSNYWRPRQRARWQGRKDNNAERHEESVEAPE